jgi:hypothetical protein
MCLESHGRRPWTHAALSPARLPLTLWAALFSPRRFSIVRFRRLRLLRMFFP